MIHETNATTCHNLRNMQDNIIRMHIFSLYVIQEITGNSWDSENGKCNDCTVKFFIQIEEIKSKYSKIPKMYSASIFEWYSSIIKKCQQPSSNCHHLNISQLVLRLFFRYRYKFQTWRFFKRDLQGRGPWINKVQE